MSELTLLNIPVNQIVPNPEFRLRDVDKTAEQFLDLMANIKQYGVLQPIQVRPAKTPDGKDCYELLDGLQRWTISCDLGLETIPCTVADREDSEILLIQIASNMQRVDTKPADYARSLRRLLVANRHWTLSDLAKAINRNITFIKQRLSLTELNKDIQDLVDEGSIPLSPAYILAKLPPAEQPNFVDRARSLQLPEFTAQVENRLNEIKAAAREGRAPKQEGFAPKAIVRKASEIESAASDAGIAKIVAVCGLEPNTDITNGVKAALQWILQLDSDSVEKAKTKWEQDKAKREAEKKARAEQRAAASGAAKANSDQSMARLFGLSAPAASKTE